MANSSDPNPNPVPSKAPHGRKKRVVLVFLALSLSVALSLAGMELVLRALWGSPIMPFPPDSIRPDPDLGTVLVPNFRGIANTGFSRTRFETNSQGLRDEERSLRKAPGVYRILAVGDSFVAGYGVEYEEMFLTVCEREMAVLTPGPPVEIVKAGVGGWGPWNEWKFLETRGARYSPDMVLVAFYLGNDFVDPESQLHAGAWNGVYLRRAHIENMTRLRAFRVFLRKSFYLYGLAESAAKRIAIGNEYLRQEDKTILLKCAPDSEPYASERAKQAFENIRDWCKDREIPLRVLILPHRAQMERERAAQIAREFHIETQNLDYLRPSALAARFFEEISIQVLDPAPDLREWAADGKEVSFRFDVHYTALTHAFLGKRFLAPRLMEIIRPATEQTTP